MSVPSTWWAALGDPDAGTPTGLVDVRSADPELPPEQRALLERAAGYGARYVFFQRGSLRVEPVALVFVDDGLSDADFAKLHKRLWSWGAVPLVYRKVRGRIDLMRCAHRPDFESADGQLRYAPFRHLDIASAIAIDLDEQPWWDPARLQLGAIWDDPARADDLLHGSRAAHASLLAEIERLRTDVIPQTALADGLAERLLIMALLIAYLEDRGRLDPSLFSGTAGEHGEDWLTGSRFFRVLEADSAETIFHFFDRLADVFNGDVFRLDAAERDGISTADLEPFARLVGGVDHEGQLCLWRRYTFRDLPVELISRIYELFLDEAGAVYTPPFLARIVVAEALSAERITRVLDGDEIILDPACGSGIFLVEAYKRLILHWRARNGWRRPDAGTSRRLLGRVHGVDKQGGAVELAAFSLCIALCEALDDEQLRDDEPLFPSLRGTQLHEQCFFDWLDGQPAAEIGVVLGNPPFKSRLDTPGARRHQAAFEREVGGPVPDTQLAFLFLQRALAALRTGGMLGMLQPVGLLYNLGPQGLRAHLLETWDLREVIDLVKIRGLFSGADTKTVCVLIEAQPPPADRQILHITPARTKRVVARQGLDVDYYDLHWLDRADDLSDHVVWRSGLLGGRRTLTFARRLARFRTLGALAEAEGWTTGEGYIKGTGGQIEGAEHLFGLPHIPGRALGRGRLDQTLMDSVPAEPHPILRPRAPALFSAPLLLIREHHGLGHVYLDSGSFAFKDQVVGLAAQESGEPTLREWASWLSQNIVVLRAYAAITCARLFNRRNTAISHQAVLALPMPESADLDLSSNEQVIVEDVSGPYSELIRDARRSSALQPTGPDDLDAFAALYAAQVSLLFPGLRPLAARRWSGLICQPFVFGDAELDWSGSGGLRGRLDRLVYAEDAPGLHLRRVVRLYDDRFVIMLKPDVRRFWLRSVALRDADETLVDLTRRGA